MSFVFFKPLSGHSKSFQNHINVCYDHDGHVTLDDMHNTCDSRVSEFRHRPVSEAVPSKSDSIKTGAACCTVDSSPRSSTMKLDRK